MEGDEKDRWEQDMGEREGVRGTEGGGETWSEKEDVPDKMRRRGGGAIVQTAQREGRVEEDDRGRKFRGAIDATY